MKKNQGVTLVIALVMLLLLTIIGFAAMQSSVFHEKISSNVRDVELSFQAAETALKEAENWLTALTVEPAPTATCAAQPCVLTTDPTRMPETRDQTWWANNSASAPALTGVKTPPRYIIEYSRYVPDDITIGYGYIPLGTTYYRVTVVGTGASDEAITILQSTVGKRY